MSVLKRLKKIIDWAAVESAMRRSVVGRAAEQDYDLCRKAYKSDSEKYSELSRKVRSEEFEAEKAKWRGK